MLMRVGIAALLLGLLVGWQVATWRQGAVMFDAQIEADRVADGKQGKIRKLEAEGLNRERAYREETDNLRRAVAAGTVRLRIAATCPPAAGPTSVGDAGAPELTAAAGQDYYALRDGIQHQYNQIITLQGVVRQCTQETPDNG